MQLTVLGRYGPYPAPGGACSGYLLAAGGRGYLIDCGAGVLSRVQAFLPLSSIAAIFLSHLHFDHISDLFILRYALQMLYASGDILKPTLKVVAPPEPEREFGMLSQLGAFEMIKLQKGLKLSQDGLDIMFEEMSHPFPSFAMRFEHGGKSFVYSGDTNCNERLAPFAKDTDLLLADCAFLHKDKTPASPHMSAREAAEIANEAQANRLLCSHFSPFSDPKHITAEAYNIFRGAAEAEEMRTYEV